MSFFWSWILSAMHCNKCQRFSSPMVSKIRLSFFTYFQWNVLHFVVSFSKVCFLGRNKKWESNLQFMGNHAGMPQARGAVMGLSGDCYKSQFWKAILKSLVLGEKVMNATLFIYSLTHERILSKLFSSTIRKARRNCFNINFSWNCSSFLISSRKRWSSPGLSKNKWHCE